jgi:hypothetical protein
MSKIHLLPHHREKRDRSPVEVDCRRMFVAPDHRATEPYFLTVTHPEAPDEGRAGGERRADRAEPEPKRLFPGARVRP